MQNLKLTLRVRLNISAQVTISVLDFAAVELR